MVKDDSLGRSRARLLVQESLQVGKGNTLAASHRFFLHALVVAGTGGQTAADSQQLDGAFLFEGLVPLDGLASVAGGARVFRLHARGGRVLVITHAGSEGRTGNRKVRGRS